MNRFRALVVVSLAGLTLLGPGCSSKSSKAPPTAEVVPAPVEPAPRQDDSSPSAAGLASADLRPAFFAVDSHELNAEARAALEHDGRLLREHPGVNVTIEGHCDERGTVEYNLALGERRARAARDFLVAYGIEPSRLAILSYGEERPFEQGATESAWARNRRAHLVVQ